MAAISVLGSLGHYTSPIWHGARLGRHVQRGGSRSTGCPTWAPGHRRVDADPQDGRLHDSNGSAYWWLSTLLPGFRQFRYPAKLFTFTALALAVLAGFGWDRLARAGLARSPRSSRALVVDLAALAVAVFPGADPRCRFVVTSVPRCSGRSSLWRRTGRLSSSLGQSLIVLALGFV